MALYVRLMVYMGLSLFIIRRAYVYLVVCVLTRITMQQRNKRIKTGRLSIRKYFQTEARNDAMVDAERF